MIRGKKNYLPVTPMAMGFCFFFKLDEESIANHVNDRKVKYVDNEMEAGAIEMEIANDEPDDQEELAFPDTKIRTSRSDKHEPDLILEAMKPRSKVQRKLKKPLAEKKPAAEQPSDEAQSKPTANKTNQKNKKSKGKSKKGKKDDWSDDEDSRIAIKLEKKLQKDSRLMELENQVQVLNLNDYLEESVEESVEEAAVINENGEVTTDEVADKVNNKVNDESNKESNKEQPSTNQSSTNQPNNLDDGEIVESSQATAQNEESSDDEQAAAAAAATVPDEESEEEEEEETNEERKEAEYLKLVNSLTGQPLSDDVLLYCMPVVAPYSAVQNCKFKVFEFYFDVDFEFV